MSSGGREVIIETVGILHGVGTAGGGDAGLIESMRTATNDVGTPIYTPATCLSLLVFFVLAMQCLPTSVVARRETGSWKWPARSG